MSFKCAVSRAVIMTLSLSVLQGYPFICGGGSDMVQVGSFRIDKYEASRPDATDIQAGANNVEAWSRPGVLPWNDINWFDAKRACQAAGKDLCTGEEWQRACEGESVRVYPYGDTYDFHACNGHEAGESSPVLAGKYTSCFSEEGVFDLSGNLWEWIDDDVGSRKGLRGGSFGNYGSYLRCDEEVGANPNFGEVTIGFRCCSP